MKKLPKGLGLANDSPAARPSIFNDDEEFATLTPQDEQMLRMLYNPALRPGMTISEARPDRRASGHGPAWGGKLMRALVIGLLVPLAAQAETNLPAVEWIVTHTESPLEIKTVGTWAPNSTKVIAVDSLTYAPDYKWPYTDIPKVAATFVALNDAESGRVSKAVLVFADGMPVCGVDLATMPVDTGTGAFLTPENGQALDALAGDLDQNQSDLYAGFMEPQIKGAHSFAQFLTLPDGTSFPAFSTGWGDGAYPVASLVDAQGHTVALYADFMGHNADGEWLLPPPCADQG